MKYFFLFIVLLSMGCCKHAAVKTTSNEVLLMRGDCFMLERVVYKVSKVGKFGAYIIDRAGEFHTTNILTLPQNLRVDCFDWEKTSGGQK